VVSIPNTSVGLLANFSPCVRRQSGVSLDPAGPGRHLPIGRH
jgi:hypothetical protein